MPKKLNHTSLDQAYQHVADNGSQLDVVSDTTEPTDLTNSLASTSLTTGDGNGDYTIEAGDVSGRKLTVAEQAGVSITADGEANHVVISDGAGTLLLITECDPQQLYSGNLVNVPSFSDEIPDPT